MAEETGNAEETTDQAGTNGQPDEQLQQPVNGAEQGAAQDSGEGQQGDQQNGTPEWVQKRFNQLTHRFHDADRERQQALGRAETAEQLLRTMQAQQQQGDGGQAQQPAQQYQQQQPVQSDDARIQEAAGRVVAEREYNARCNTVFEQGTGEYKDFGQALQTLGMLGMTDGFMRDVVGMDDPHKIFYTLGKNPEEASRILSLPPIQQGRELERLATKPAKAAAPKPVSNAPAPISTVDGQSGGASIDLGKASIEDFMKARNSQAKRR